MRIPSAPLSALAAIAFAAAVAAAGLVAAECRAAETLKKMERKEKIASGLDARPQEKKETTENLKGEENSLPTVSPGVKGSAAATDNAGRLRAMLDALSGATSGRDRAGKLDELRRFWTGLTGAERASIRAQQPALAGAVTRILSEKGAGGKKPAGPPMPGKK